MSLFGAMSTAISGINAQSSAFGNISDNIANSQTVGFKRVDTSFTDYLTQSTKDINDSGSVLATPDYVNSVQGTISQVIAHPRACCGGVSYQAPPIFSRTEQPVPYWPVRD